MIRLEDFDEAIEHERRNNPGGPEVDEIALLLQKASRDLLSRQAIHGDDRNLQTSYRLLNRHSGYFERLFDGFGYRLHFDGVYSYVLLLPGEVDAGSRRGRVSKEETILLFAIRVIWEEASRDGDMDDFGRIETDTEILYDRFTAMTDAEFPSRSRVKDYFATWKARGLLRIGAEDREEEIVSFTIMPVIRDLVTPALAAEVEAYLANEEAGPDVLDHLEEVRRTPPSDPNAEGTQETSNV